MKFFNKKKDKEEELTVKHIQRLTEDAICIGFEVPLKIKDKYQFEQGQYINLVTKIKGKKVKRAYSICSAFDEKLLKIAIKKVHGGIFSKYANTVLKEGDKLIVEFPKGRFVLDNDISDKQEIVLIAVGSGITPFMGMLNQFLKKENSPRFHLFYGNKSPENTMFLDDITSLSKQYPDKLFVTNIYSRVKEEGAIYGRIDTSIVLNNISDIALKKFYICGPEIMTMQMIKDLKAKNVSPKAIKYELFSTKELNKEESCKSSKEMVTLNIISEGQTYKLLHPKNKLVLEGAISNKIDVPFSCQGGVCASCIAKLEEGHVHMKMNHVLTDEEIEDGLVLTCQSICDSEIVTINYDDV